MFLQLSFVAEVSLTATTVESDLRLQASLR